jgi:RND family efflux transporter MFP subunit
MKFIKLLLVVIATAMCFTGYAGERRERTKVPVRVVLFPVKHAVISARVDSFIKHYSLLEGEEFKKGDQLATLEDNFYKQMFLRAKSACQEKESALKYSTSNLKRNEDLFRQGIAGHKELESSKLELESTQAQLDFTKANMEIARLNLEDCRIIAPFDGRLSKKVVADFEYVRAGQQLMEIIDDNQLLAVMYLPSLMKKSISKDMEMEFKIDETGSIHIGRVYEIAGEIDPRSRTFEVKALINNYDKKLSSGMSGVLIEKDSWATAQNSEQ